MLNDIKKIVKKGKYLYGVCPEHPKSIKFGYVLLHRLIIENHLNRYLNDDEVVHHKDENSHNNEINNLQVMSKSQHGMLHQKNKKPEPISSICPVCKNVFFGDKRNLGYKLRQGKIPCCSRKCRGKLPNSGLFKSR